MDKVLFGVRVFYTGGQSLSGIACVLQAGRSRFDPHHFQLKCALLAGPGKTLEEQLQVRVHSTGP